MIEMDTEKDLAKIEGTKARRERENESEKKEVSEYTHIKKYRSNDDSCKLKKKKYY